MSGGYFYLSFALLFPMAALCYIPLRSFMRYPMHITMAFVVFVYALLCLLYKPLVGLFYGHSGFLMPFVLGALFIAYVRNIQLEIIRAALIYIWAVVMVAFASGLTQIYVMVMAMHGLDVAFSLSTQLIRLFLSVAILAGGVFFAAHWKKDFLESQAIPTFYWVAWLPVPFLFLAIQIGLLTFSRDFAKLPSGLTMYLLFLIGTFILYIFLSEIFYTVSDSYVVTARLRDEQELSDIQKLQYKRLQEEMEDSSRIRHDFRHSMNLLRSLVEKEDMEGIKAFLDQYQNATLSLTMMNYCKNPTVNALLNHYAYQAKEEEVPLSIQVDLPENLPLSDPEVCSLIGNLMENAIDACKQVPKGERSFSFSILVQNEVNLYIVSSNSYIGEIKRDGERFLSTKHDGAGIGTRSVREIAKKYHGDVRFHYSEHEFFVDVLLSLS